MIEHELSPDSFINSIMHVISPIRYEMGKVENCFDYSFESKSMSVPVELKILCSLLVDGCDPQEKGFSQAALTIADLILFSYRKGVTTKQRPLSKRH